MRLRLVLGVMLLGACQPGGIGGRPSSPSRENPPQAIDALPAELATVRTLGGWSDAGREGRYRIVITEHGFDKIVSRLYLQWVQQPDEETAARVVRSVGFDELNEVPLYQLEIASVRDLPEGLEVELAGSSLYTGEPRNFLLRAGPPGSASLRPVGAAAMAPARRGSEAPRALLKGEGAATGPARDRYGR